MTAFVQAASFAVGLAVAATSAPTPLVTRVILHGHPVCRPGDYIIWLDTDTNLYYSQGAPLYGTTVHGRYECKANVVKHGARAATA